MPGFIDQLQDDLSDGDRVSVGEWLSTGGLGDDVHTGTPPPIGPGSVARSVPLGGRVAGALGFEAARSDTGQDLTREGVDRSLGPSLGGGGGGDNSLTGLASLILDNARAIAFGIVALVAIAALGRLFTFNVNVGDSA